MDGYDNDFLLLMMDDDLFLSVQERMECGDTITRIRSDDR